MKRENTFIWGNFNLQIDLEQEVVYLIAAYNEVSISGEHCLFFASTYLQHENEFVELNATILICCGLLRADNIPKCVNVL